MTAVEMSQIEPARFAELLRGDRLINDAEVMPGPDPGTVTAFVVPQGFRPGYVLRERAMRLAGPAGGRLRVVLVWELPRGPDGDLDEDAALAAMRAPGALYRFEPPADDDERAIVELVGQVLPGVQVSVTDSLPGLGGDSLATMELAALINERFGVDLDPQRLYEAESLRHLAAWCAGHRAGPGPG